MLLIPKVVIQHAFYSHMYAQLISIQVLVMNMFQLFFSQCKIIFSNDTLIERNEIQSLARYFNRHNYYRILIQTADSLQ